MNRLGRWSRAGGWAIADRGLFSLSNFLVSLLLARWLGESAYSGIYALALAAFLLAGALYGGWVTEPLLVFGSSRYKECFEEYLGFLLIRHVRFSVWATAAGLVLAASAHLMDLHEAGLALAVAALATPWILLQWFGRLACYTSVGPRRAAIAGGAQLALVAVGLIACRRLGVLSTEVAFGLLGATGALTGGFLVGSLKPRRPGLEFSDEARRLHRSYGGWAASTGLLTWIPGQVYYVVLPAIGAVAAAGHLRALMNLVLPLMQAYVALSTVLTTAFARLRDTPRFGRLVRFAGIGLVIGALIYGAMLFTVGPALMNLLYDGRYNDLAPLLPVVAVIPLLGVGATVLSPALRALERPDLVFVAYAASTVSSLTIGMLLIARFGVVGAAVGLVISTAVTTTVLGWKMFTIFSRRRSQVPGAMPGDAAAAGSPSSSTIMNSRSE